VALSLSVRYWRSLIVSRVLGAVNKRPLFEIMLNFYRLNNNSGSFLDRLKQNADFADDSVFFSSSRA